MTTEIRKANFILKHAEQYDRDPIFKQMVDNTVYLTQAEIEESHHEVTRLSENH